MRALPHGRFSRELTLSAETVAELASAVGGNNPIRSDPDLITYDARMRTAAETIGCAISAPS